MRIVIQVLLTVIIGFSIRAQSNQDSVQANNPLNLGFSFGGISLINGSMEMHLREKTSTRESNVYLLFGAGVGLRSFFRGLTFGAGLGCLFENGVHLEGGQVFGPEITSFQWVGVGSSLNNNKPRRKAKLMLSPRYSSDGWFWKRDDDLLGKFSPAVSFGWFFQLKDKAD